MNDTLYIVIPCYNEEEVLHETVKRLTAKFDKMIEENSISENSRIMLVNDGSKDRTWEIINELYTSNKYVTGVCLSRNKGHQNALLAGLMTAKEYADMVISMDADLQDDVDAVDKFVEEYKNGAEIVYGVRNSRKKDTFFKKTTALMFYRLMSKRALNELANFKEVNLFLRGIIPMIGFKTAIVEYERNERFAGESKYPLSKMISFAVEGITSCSVKPLRMITSAGLIVSFLSFIYLIYVIIGFCMGRNIQGWTTTVVLICLFGGAQILCLGIIGEYVGKIYNEVKQRPRFIISEELLK